MQFEILKKSQNSNARLGIIRTPHGNVLTPAFIFCGTKANIKGITIDQVKNEHTQIILSNTYHLLLQPGPDIIKRSNGLQTFTGWNGPMFTDSGGYQVFSLGYGSVSSEIKGTHLLPKNKTLLKITENGAVFRSYIDGQVINLTPEISIKTQIDLGADIIVCLDECSPFHISKRATELSMLRSIRWGMRSLDEFNRHETKQGLLAVIQGGIYEDLRKESAAFANSNNFFGYAIGGSLGKTVEQMQEIVRMTKEMLDKNRYVHLLGIGGIKDIFHGVKCGIDTFDCVTPTRIARHGIALIKHGNNHLNLCKNTVAYDISPIISNCNCYTCRHFSKSYIHHLLRAHEILGGILITIHNIRFMNQLMEDIRKGIQDNDLNAIYNDYC